MFMVHFCARRWHVLEAVTAPIVFTVDNRLRVSVESLPPGVPESLKAACEHKNPTFFKQRSMGYKAFKEKPVIATWRERRGELSLPRGATQLVRQVFDRAGLPEPEWDDQRVVGSNVEVGAPHAEHRMRLYEHQEEAVQAAIERENCLVRAPTGSGKTTAAIALAARVNLPTLVVVWSAKLFDQWVQRLCSELGWQKKQVGQIRGSKRTIGPITMAMQQTLYANPKVVRQLRPMFGCVMADEVQRFAARTFLDVVDAFPARYRVGWSADETRKDRKEFLIYDVFGNVAADIPDSVLVDKALVHDVEVRVVPTDFTASWYVDQKNAEDENPDFNRLLDNMAADGGRNRIITGLVRTEQALGNQVLALTHRREHAMSLARNEASAGNKCGVMIGGQEFSREFDATVQAMRAGTLGFGVGTYQAIGQGLDIPGVQRGVACTPIATNRQFFGQVRGRLCRIAPGKKDAVLFYLWDQHVFGLDPLINLRRWNRNVRVQVPGGWQDVNEYLKAHQRRTHG